MEFRRKEISWLNKNVNMRELLDYAGFDIEPSGRCFCPFHYNVNTPAAKFFDEGNDMRCFSEQRTYRVFDLMKLLHWSEDRIRGLLPDDIAWDYGLDDRVEILVPIIEDSVIKAYNTNVYDLLQELNRRWLDKDNVECRVLNR